jgi:hypothetical protein
MYNCDDNVLSYHNDEVTLPQPERTHMRDRRNANRDRLKKNLKDKGKPLPVKFIKQGSYAMLTMVQDAEKDYDIDDGVYFAEADLKGANGISLTPWEVREMVKDALYDPLFNRQPKNKGACVRVFYAEGYHVDLPIYRIRTFSGDYELAFDDNWTHSRAADVEDWFNEQNKRSPDTENGRQFRRLVRMIKKFSRSRNSWKSEIASGFTITKLVSEQYKPSAREDEALRNTMQAVHDRLVWNLVVSHPVTPGAFLSKGSDDPKLIYFRDRLKDALEDLKVLDKADCTRKQAQKAWDRVFNTTHFSDRVEKADTTGSLLKAAAVPAAGGLRFPDNPVRVNKPAGFA